MLKKRQKWFFSTGIFDRFNVSENQGVIWGLSGIGEQVSVEQADAEVLQMK